MSFQRSLLRAALPRSSLPALVSPSAVPLILLRSASSSSPPPSSSPSSPASVPKVRPPLRSLAQIKADKAVEQLRLDTLAGTGWTHSKEKGQEDQEERIVYNRPSGQANILIWGFMLSQTVCLVAILDLIAGTTFILPPPRSPPPSTPSELTPTPSSFSSEPTYPQPYVSSDRPKSLTPSTSDLPLETIIPPWSPPYVVLLVLGTVALGLPVGLLQGWAKKSIVQIKSLRPSNRIKVTTKRDSLLKWVQRGDGRTVDFGVAAETYMPDGVSKSSLITLHLPLGRNGAAVSRRIDLGPPSKDEIAVAEARGSKVIVNRDLISQTFQGIQDPQPVAEHQKR